MGQDTKCSVKLSRLSKKFNLLMQTLFSLNSEVNTHIANKHIDTIFMLKYVIFAHDFMSNFDNQIDETFSSVLLSTDRRPRLDEFLAKMDTKFQSFAEAKHLAEENAEFNLLIYPKDRKLLELFEKNKDNEVIIIANNLFEKIVYNLFLFFIRKREFFQLQTSSPNCEP